MLDEPLQEVELVKEKTVEFFSYSTEYLDDGNGGDDPDLDPLISDISVQQIPGAKCNAPVFTPLHEMHMMYILNDHGVELKAKAPPLIGYANV